MTSPERRHGAFFECSPKEGDAAFLHRMVAGGSPARYNLIHAKETNGIMAFDVALPRNYAKWYEFLPEDLLDQFALRHTAAGTLCAMCSIGISWSRPAWTRRQ